jgi:hypothetical protein
MMNGINDRQLPQRSVGLQRALCLLDLIATKGSNTPNSPLPINRGQHRQALKEI